MQNNQHTIGREQKKLPAIGLDWNTHTYTQLIKIFLICIYQTLSHQKYQKPTEVAVNIINNKAEFQMKKKYLITEMRRSASPARIRSALLPPCG